MIVNVDSFLKVHCKEESVKFMALTIDSNVARRFCLKTFY